MQPKSTVCGRGDPQRYPIAGELGRSAHRRAQRRIFDRISAAAARQPAGFLQLSGWPLSDRIGRLTVFFLREDSLPGLIDLPKGQWSPALVASEPSGRYAASAHAPGLAACHKAGISFIRVTNPTDHKLLFQWVHELSSLEEGGRLEFAEPRAAGTHTAGSTRCRSMVGAMPMRSISLSTGAQ